MTSPSDDEHRRSRTGDARSRAPADAHEDDPATDAKAVDWAKVGAQWTRIGAIAAVGGLIFAAIQYWPSSGSGSGDEKSSDARPSPSSIVSEGDADADGDTGSPGCLDGDLTLEACQRESALYVLAELPSCDPAGLGSKLQLGLHEGVIDVKAAMTEHGCALRAGEAIAKANVGVAEIRTALSGDIPDSLRLCALQSTDVSCSQRHDLEYLNDWMDETVEDPLSECLALAQDFTDRRLVEPAEMLEPVALREPVQERYRCAIRSSTDLVGSVYSIGTGRLPRA